MPPLNSSAAAERARLERAAGAPEPDESLTIRRLCLRFLEWAETYYPPRRGQHNNEVRNFRDAFSHLGPWMDLPAARFTARCLRGARQGMIERGLARSTVNARTTKIRRAFRWAVEREFVPAETWHSLQAIAPLARGRSPAAEPEPVEAISESAFWATAGRAPPVIRAMMELQWWTGMRPGEVCAITGAAIRIPDWVYTPRHHKTDWRGHARTIYLGPNAQAIVRGWFTPGYLFRSRFEQPYTVNGYYQCIRAAARRAGLEAWGPNRIRHAAATRFERELGIEAARLLLGHASADTTAIYIHRDERAAIEAARRVG